MLEILRKEDRKMETLAFCVACVGVVMFGYLLVGTVIDSIKEIVMIYRYKKNNRM